MTRSTFVYFPAWNALLAAASLVGFSAAVSLAQEGAPPPAPPSQEELQQQLTEALEQGNAQLEEEDFAAAIESFDVAVRLTGSINPTPLFLRAKAYTGAEEYELALADLKDALTYGASVNSLPAQIRNLRAEVYLGMGAVDRALKDATAAVREFRNQPGFQLNYGEALVRSGSPVDGVKALTRYIDFDAENAKAYRLRSQGYAMQRKFAKANNDADRAIQLDGEDHENHFLKASILLQEENYADAADALKDAINNYTPDDPELPIPYSQAYLTRASALEELGKQAEDPEAAQAAYAEEKRECEALLEQLPEEDAFAPSRAAALFRLGVAERLLGNLAPAVKAFTDAIDLNPGLGEAYFRRGICFFYLGEPGLALGDFKQGAAINFASPRSNLWKGRCHTELGDFREAIKAYSAAVAVSDRYTVAYVHRGLAYLQLLENDRAIADFNQAIRLEPTEGRHYYYRGLAYERAGDLERAITSTINAIKFAPTLVEAYDVAATLLQRAGRGTLAEEYRRRAAELRGRG